MEIPEEVRNDVIRMQSLQQKMQSMLVQKQTVQMQVAEIDSALKDLEGRKEGRVYEIVGSIMLEKGVVELSKSLKDKKDIFDLRLKSYDKQIKNVNDELIKLQESVASRMSGKR